MEKFRKVVEMYYIISWVLFLSYNKAIDLELEERF